MMKPIFHTAFSTLPFVLCAGALAGIGLPAHAEFKYENDTGFTASFYGQFNPAYVTVDDGVSSYEKLVDNAHSNSRVGVWLRQLYGANRFSFNFETGLGLRPSSLVTQGFAPKALNWQRANIRKADFSLETESFGTFFAGQGSMSHDGAAQVDFSGTTLVTYVSIGDTAGAYRFRTDAGTLSTSAITLAMPDFDGGRRGRVRYDTPEFGGLTVSVSWGKEILIKASDLESRSIAMRYAGEIGDLKLSSALAYAQIKPGNGPRRDDLVGSLSILHASGLNVSMASGSRKNSGSYGYVKLGYRAGWFSVGETALSVDYYRGRGISSSGSRSTSVGFGAVQSFDNADLDAYFGYQSYGLDEVTANYQDASSVIAGVRWKF
jgi:hypothetical protein